MRRRPTPSQQPIHYGEDPGRQRCQPLCRDGRGGYLLNRIPPTTRQRWPQPTQLRSHTANVHIALISRFMGPTWGPSGADRTQVGPMLVPWTLLSGSILLFFILLYGIYTGANTTMPTASNKRYNHFVKITRTITKLSWTTLDFRYDTFINNNLMNLWRSDAETYQEFSWNSLLTLWRMYFTPRMVS